jgi:hypothetical protein
MNIPLEQLIESICKRPEMYTMHGAFGEVAAFLDGYASARIGEQMDSLADFQVWLAHRIGKGKNLSWSGLIKIAYEDDETRLANLPLLYRYYLTSLNNQKDSSAIANGD